MNTPQSKILTLEDAAAWRKQLAADKKRLAVTNGCFDLLHRGHAEYLMQARSRGDALLVLLNSDESVRELKGPTRPINTAYDRAFLLAGFSFVDAVVVFSGKRCTKELQALSPDVYVKGGDYTVETLDAEERAALLQAKSQFVFIPFVPNHSTSSALQKLQEAEKREKGMLYSAVEIQKRVAELGKEISAFYQNQEVTIVALLNGGMLFAADLARRISSPCKIDSLAVSSYQDDRSTGCMKIRSELKNDPKGKNILIVDDILDTGLSLAYAVKYFQNLGAASVRTCVFLNKELPADRKKWNQAEWTGFNVPDVYIIGYGLDSNESYRNLDYIGYVKS